MPGSSAPKPSRRRLLLLTYLLALLCPIGGSANAQAFDWDKIPDSWPPVEKYGIVPQSDSYPLFDPKKMERFYDGRGQFGGCDKPSAAKHVDSLDSAQNAALQRDLAVAAYYRKFLAEKMNDDLICAAVADFVGGTAPSACASERGKPNKTLRADNDAIEVQISTLADQDPKYDITIVGQSIRLALKDTDRTERHKIRVTAGFDSALKPIITVFDYDQQERNWPNIHSGTEAEYREFESDTFDRVQAFQNEVRAVLAAKVSEYARGYSGLDNAITVR